MQRVKNKMAVLVSAAFCNMLTFFWTLNPLLQKNMKHGKPLHLAISFSCNVGLKQVK